MDKEHEGEGKPKYKRPSRAKPGAKRGHDAETMKKVTAAAAAARKAGTTEKKATEMMELFAMHYVQNWNATKSAKLAGYSETSAHRIGPGLLKHPAVMKLLAEHREGIKTDHRKTHEALAEYYLRVLTADASELMAAVEEALNSGNPLPDGAGMLIESIKVREVVAGFEVQPGGKQKPIMGKQVEFKVFGKTIAADMLNKHVGFYEKDNSQQPASMVGVYIPDNGREDETALPAKKEEELDGEQDTELP